jgi:hypothetical protein
MFPNQHWFAVKDGDCHSRWFFNRHYSRHFYRDGRKPKLFVGPGEKMILTTFDGLALFIWRKFISLNHQSGVNCAVFRNEGSVLSSQLILEAEALAWQRWPGERLYTYVNGHAVYGDGCCFKKAGWKKLKKRTKSGLIILEKWPLTANNDNKRLT